MGPSELSLAMECPKRLLWSLQQNDTGKPIPFSSESESNINGPILQGLLFESLIQFLACGTEDMPNSGEDAWEERFCVIEIICNELMLGNEPFLETFAQTLGMNTKTSQQLCGWWFENSSIDNILGWVIDFFEEPTILKLMDEAWDAEIPQTGNVNTPLGQCSLNGRIDLRCKTKMGLIYIFEIKARNKFKLTDERQLEMYHQMLDKDPLITLILLRGGDFITSIKYLEHGFDGEEYEPEDIERGTPKQIVCSRCRVPNCHERMLGH